MIDKQTNNTNKMMTRQQVCDYVRNKFGLQLSPLTLEKFASQGGGPSFYRFGTRRVYYYESDIDAWVNTRLGRALRSTSDSGQGAYA
jgi:predicted DNA-binding transcriptional regulator AlpA